MRITFSSGNMVVCPFIDKWRGAKAAKKLAAEVSTSAHPPTPASTLALALPTPLSPALAASFTPRQIAPVEKAAHRLVPLC
jgi:hypothetical protein